MLKKADVIIVGGGMVGASLALALPEAFNVAVVERFALPKAADTKFSQPSFDSRATALSQSSINFFKQKQLWPQLEPGASLIHHVHVSDQGRWGSMLMDAGEAEPLGVVMENAVLGQNLLAALKQKPNVTWLSPATVEQIKMIAGGAQVTLQGSETETTVLHTKLLVIADGANSSCCQKLGIDHEIWDYQQTAIVANVATNKPHSGIAYERFTERGPLALLPLIASNDAANRSALIWTVPQNKAETMLAMNDQDFLAELQQQFGDRQGNFTAIGKRVSYPLKLSQAKEQVRQNLVVLGNAAHSLHPVAGQGFNLALRDVACLVQVLEQAHSAGENYASIEVLQRYYQLQHQDQKLTTWFSDYLPQVFGSKRLPLRALRGAGLLALELSPWAKNEFIQFATGKRKRRQ